MNDNEFTGPQSPRRRRHAWANTKEVYDWTLALRLLLRGFEPRHPALVGTIAAVHLSHPTPR